MRRRTAPELANGGTERNFDTGIRRPKGGEGGQRLASYPDCHTTPAPQKLGSTTNFTTDNSNGPRKSPFGKRLRAHGSNGRMRIFSGLPLCLTKYRYPLEHLVNSQTVFMVSLGMLIKHKRSEL